MLNELCTSLAEMKKRVDAEALQQATVKNSPEYLHLAEKIEELMEAQNALLAPLPDSRGEYDTLRREVMDAMNKEGVYAVGQVAAKWKEKNEVNKEKVMTVIGGDIDIYFTLSNVTQVKLKEFAKENPELKKPLLDCVETVSREIVDLTIEAPLPTPHAQ